MLILLKQTEEEGRVCAFWKAEDKETLLEKLKEEHPNPYLLEQVEKIDTSTPPPINEIVMGLDRYCLISLVDEEGK